MKPAIQPYTDEKQTLITLIEELQDHLVSIDPEHLRIRKPEYGKEYIENLLKKIKKNEGTIFIATLKSEPVGMIAGIIEEFTHLDSLEFKKVKTGRILELIVNESHRNHKIGQSLMNKLEAHFKSAHCDLIRVEVFSPNLVAHGFYQKLGYSDRFVDMMKRI
ncbi:GNAT family N-acetyltransferase [Patescibacteria group bacterium]|nr:GNAT family N-acetyltransferase [Patescibacteria group bacterium]